MSEILDWAAARRARGLPALDTSAIAELVPSGKAIGDRVRLASGAEGFVTAATLVLFGYGAAQRRVLMLTVRTAFGACACRIDQVEALA